MSNLANAQVEGFVTHEPVLRETRTGKSVCNFSLAVNHYAGSDDEPRVSYVDVETWEKLAKVCAEGITKGKRIMIFGNLRQDRWEGKDGKLQSKIKVVGNRVRFLESYRSSDPDGEKPAEAA